MGAGRLRLALMGGLVASLAAVAGASADFVWDLEATIDPPETNDAFGRAIDLSGSTLVTGAPSDDTLLPNAGAVWVHDRNEDGSWDQTIKLTPSPGTNNGQFGSAVALDIDAIAVGAPFEDDGTGAVYVFTRDFDATWSQEARLSVPDAPLGANVGDAIAIAGNTLVAGAPGEGTGVVYVFQRTAGIWGVQQRLAPTNAAAGDLVGDAVALSGDTILAGATLADPSGTSSGAVHVFVRDGAGAWRQQARLLPGDGSAGDLFGGDVDLIADLAVIGARGNDDGGDGSGSAYVFSRSTEDIWSQVAKLTASDPAPAGLFGSAVAIDGTQMVVGAPGTGTVSVFDLPALSEAGTISGDPPAGSAVSVDGDSLAIATQEGLSGVVETFIRSEELLPPPVPVGIVDPGTAEWELSDGAGTTISFVYGVPGDIPLVGDWDCDGIDTPGMFRPSNGFVYLRNSNTSGFADVTFFYGIGGDVPIAGDWDGDGCDTVAIYRDGEVYIRNSNTTGVAERVFFYGIPTDTPFAGDFDGDGHDTVGLYRESTGFVFLRNSLSSGFADADFFYGIAGDKILAFDWDGDGDDTVAIFRSSERRFYINNENRQAFADFDFRHGQVNSLPVVGQFVS